MTTAQMLFDAFVESHFLLAESGDVYAPDFFKPDPDYPANLTNILIDGGVDLQSWAMALNKLSAKGAR